MSVSRAVVALFVLLLLGGGLFTACGDDGEDDVGSLPVVDQPSAPPRSDPPADRPPTVPPPRSDPPLGPPPAPDAPRDPDPPIAPGSSGGADEPLTALEKRYAGKGAVVTREGIKLKLITTQEDCPIYAEPREDAKSANVGLWKFFFVLPPDPNAPTRLLDSLESKYGGYQTRNNFYRVSRFGDETLQAGWLRAGDVVEWHHRQVLRPTSGRRGKAYFWREREKAKAAAVFGGTLPSNPIAKEPDEGAVKLLLPLLKRYEETIGGDQQDLYRVAFIGAPAGRAPPSSPGDPGGRAPITRQDAIDAATVDIVFVIDTTKSMTHAIGQVRRSVEEATKILAELPEMKKGRLRFGLVGYRDTLRGNPAIEYTVKVFCDLVEGTDHRHFQQVLDKLTVSSGGSIDYPEDVLAGLATALDTRQMHWNPVSASLVVLVGDASAKHAQHPAEKSRENEPWPLELGGQAIDHPRRTIGTLLALAQPGADTVGRTGRAQIGFLAILVDQSPGAEGVLLRGLKTDLEESERQFGALANGRPSGVRGSLVVVQGGVNPAGFSGPLADLMKQQMREMRKVLINPESVSVPKDATAATAPVGFIQLLRALPGADTDAEFQFARGYCSQLNNQGERQFDPYYLVNRRAVRKFLGGLNAFLEILNVSDRDVSQIVDGLQLISGMLAYDQKIDADTALKDILESELGLPVQNDVFKYTPSMLRSLPQGEFDQWLRNVESVRDGLDVLVNTAEKWHALERDSGYGFVAVSELP